MVVKKEKRVNAAANAGGGKKNKKKKEKKSVALVEKKVAQEAEAVGEVAAPVTARETAPSTARKS